ncbi:hypothetical protein ACIPSJ_45190 [Streptomyces sp. NPDC090088]
MGGAASGIEPGDDLIARMLDYHDDTTARLAEEAEGTWRHQAPGDHSQ